MFRTLWYHRRPILTLGALALFAFGGWLGLLYSALASRSEIGQLRAERDAAVGEYAKLAKSAGDLSEVATKLARAKAEYDRTALAWAETRQKLASAQQDLATASRRQDAKVDPVSHTGSVPPKPPARRPSN